MHDKKRQELSNYKVINRLPSTMKINFSQNESIAIDKQQLKGEVT